jgi:hypothetical protein
VTTPVAPQSPDLTPYAGLTLDDRSPQDFIDLALQDALSKMPGYKPMQGSTEVVLIENLALIIGELVQRLNFVPLGVTKALLAQLYGLPRSLGTAAKASALFTLADTKAHVVPAGTRVGLSIAGTMFLFTTDQDLTIADGAGQGTVGISAVDFTDQVNGVAQGSVLQLVDSVAYVQTVTLATTLSGGTLPETDDAYLNRGAQVLRRLTSTLVTPDNFIAQALTEAYVFRATAVDNYDPTTLVTPDAPTLGTATTGGTLAAATYGYRITQTGGPGNGETLPSAEATIVVPAGTATNVVTVSWPTLPNGSKVNVYGRTAGGELLLASGITATSWTDTGSINPAGALPVSNTTGGTPGADPGNIAVACLDANGNPLAASDKNALLAVLQGQASANLAVHMIDPTITPVAVTATVVAIKGADTNAVMLAAEAALQAYLSPKTWPWAGTVRVNELISLLDQVQGVDYVVGVTAPAGDLALPGAAPLASYATPTITVNPQ